MVTNREAGKGSSSFSSREWGGIDSRSMIINLISIMLFTVNYYIVAPTANAYAIILGADGAFGAALLGASSLSVIISTIIYSIWCTIPSLTFRHALLLSSLVAAIGNLLYSLAISFHSLPMALLGRLLVGLGSAEVVNRQIIASCVSYERMMPACAMFVTCGSLGMCVGPLLAAVLDEFSGRDVDVNIKMRGMPNGGIIYNYVTSPGFVMVALWLVEIVAILGVFEEPERINNTEKSKGMEEDRKADDESVGMEYAVVVDDAHGINPRFNDRQIPFWKRAYIEENPDKFNVNGILSVMEKEKNPRLDDDMIPYWMYACLEEDLETFSETNKSWVFEEEKIDGGSFSTESTLDIIEDRRRIKLKFNEKMIPCWTRANIGEKSSETSGNKKMGAIEMTNKEKKINDSMEYVITVEEGRGGKQISDDNVIPCWRRFFLEIPMVYKLIVGNPALLVTLYILGFVEYAYEVVIASCSMVVRRYFHWHGSIAGFLIALLGALILPAHFVVDWASICYEERQIMKYAMVIILVGLVAIINYQGLIYDAIGYTDEAKRFIYQKTIMSTDITERNEIAVYLNDQLEFPYDGKWGGVVYLTAVSVIFMGSIILESVDTSIMSKIVPPELNDTVFNIGLLSTLVGTLGRIVGDGMITVALLLDVYVYNDFVNVTFIPLIPFALWGLHLVKQYYEPLAS